MKVDYDSGGDTIQIVLEPVDRLERDNVDITGVIVGFRDQRPVMIDVIGTPTGVNRRLQAVASTYDLDSEALSAAVWAALAVPDRAVTIDIGPRLEP